MELNVERLGPVEVKLNFEIAADECARDLKAAYKAYAKQKRLPGFRPGKVPVKRIKKEAQRMVEHEVSNQIIDRAYREALRQEDLQPVMPPNVDGHPHVHEGESFAFAMTVEIRPAIELKTVEGLAVSLPKYSVTDEDVAKDMERLRLQKASFSDVDEGVEATVEHRITISYIATDGDEELGRSDSQAFWLGDADIEAGLRDALLGQTVGASFDTDITFSEDNENVDVRGKAIAHHFDVLKLENIELPEVDDEFAKGFQAEDPADLTKKLREMMEAKVEQNHKNAVAEAVVDALIEANPFEVPTGLVNHQLDNMVRNTFRGMQPEQLAQMGVDLDTMKNEIRPSALRSVQAGLLLEEIAEAESLAPAPQSVAQELVNMSRETGKPLAEVQQAYRRPEMLESLVGELRNRMALDFVIEKAEVAEQEGDS
jgi:trigger factor